MRCVLLLLLVVACQSVSTSDEARLRAVIDELYTAFDWEPGGQPDWATQRDLYLDGAVFVSRGRVQDTDAFLASFSAWVRMGEYAESGLHERILSVRMDHFGGVAHAWVSFEAHVPGEEDARTRGLDSLQFVDTEEGWRLISFTTQYEGEELELPSRFRR